MNSVEPLLSLEQIKQTNLRLFHQYSNQLIESELATAMAYTLKPKSKYVRPLLIACVAATKLEHTLTQKAMLAIELVHTYSLIHDDLPAMDDDHTRRGQPSCHIAFDESTAILAGDALLTEAFSLLSDPTLGYPSEQLALCQILADASGRYGMALGQWQDLHPGNTIDEKSITSMYKLKTGKLIEAAIKMGMTCLDNIDANTKQALMNIGQKLGLAFQIKDDLLDLLPESKTGKPQYSDQNNHKQTYLNLFDKQGLEQQLIQMKQSIYDELNQLRTKPYTLMEFIEETLSQP